jgi:signal transduction histidine kinase
MRLTAVRSLRSDPLKLDRTLAVLLTATLELEVWAGDGAGRHRLELALIGAVMTAAIGFRRLYPAAIGIGVGLLAVLVAAAWKPPELVSYLIAWMCAMYGLAVWSRSRQFVLGIGLITVVTLISVTLPGARVGPSLQFLVGSLIAVLLVRRVVGDRERRAQLAERERDVAAREAVVEERARIARELHDAIAHNVSMIALQAGAERRTLDRNGSTHEVLETIERIGRDALTEMRRLVGMLRSDAGDPLAPQPRLHDLPQLVSQVRDAGLPVDLNVEGKRRELPVGIELSAYRIIQEALTNALKHAGDARATINVHYRRDTLELEVVDTGTGNGAGTPGGGGHGLVGMRERAALCGGRLDAGRLPDGGFAVHVLLPLR